MDPHGHRPADHYESISCFTPSPELALFTSRFSSSHIGLSITTSLSFKHSFQVHHLQASNGAYECSAAQVDGVSQSLRAEKMVDGACG